VQHLRVYGSRVYVKKESSQVTKLKALLEKGCLVDCDVEAKPKRSGWRERRTWLGPGY
jgi:hypothetical protein